jgi:outer membrane autotransporter protein
VLLKYGYDFQTKRFTTGPTLSLDYHRLWIDDFAETGAGALNAYLPNQCAESLQIGLGWQIALQGFDIGKCLLLPRFSVSYQHEFSNDSRSIAAQLVEGGGIFQVRTKEPDRDFAILGCGLQAKFNQRISLDLNYQASVGQEDYSAQSINGALRFNF